MATPAQALDKYSATVRAIKDHIEANKAVFGAHQNLVIANIDAENELRDAVAAAGVGASNRDHVVTLTPQTQTIVDPDDLRAAAGRQITPDLIAALVKTYQRPPRISIRDAGI